MSASNSVLPHDGAIDYADAMDVRAMFQLASLKLLRAPQDSYRTGVCAERLEHAACAIHDAFSGLAHFLGDEGARDAMRAAGVKV